MSMTLKESFRYQNFLDSILGEVECYLRSTENYMVITEEHLRSKAIASAEDEVTDNLSRREYITKPDVLVDFLVSILLEKIELTKAISAAKTQHCSEFDAFVENNKKRRNVVDVLKRMAQAKGRDSMVKGSSYALNGEGNQIEYRYDIKRTSKIDFNRVKVKELATELAEDSDRASATIDYWQTSVPVNFEPHFNINDSLVELLEEYEASGDPVGVA